MLNGEKPSCPGFKISKTPAVPMATASARRHPIRSLKNREEKSSTNIGEVNKPGVYYPNLDYSLTELISTSGLNQLTANAKSVYVIREKFESFLEVDVFQLDVKNPINLIAGRKFQLQPKDIVFIPASKIVKWNRTISLLLPQTDLFNSYNPIIQDGVKGGTNINLTE